MNVKWCIAVGAFAALIAAPLPGQTPRDDGRHPDLTGIWTNATLTPLTRPAALSGKPTLNEAEARVFARLANEELQQQDGASDGPLIAAAGSSGTGGYNVLFIDRGSQLARVDGAYRTSLIVDPPDGKLPRRMPRPPGTARSFMNFDDVKNRPLSERCIVGFGSTSGPPMLPVLYNNNYQIVQTPSAVMIMVEMIHDVRIVRINGMHPPHGVKQWLGDSIGRWEGETLVIDTTGFDPRNTFYGTSPDLHVTERLKRIDAGTLLYRATIEDPSFAAPFTLEYPFLASPGPIYEYACHEGNYSMSDILGGARKSDAAKN